MKTALGVVEQGRVRLLEEVTLPEGCQVVVQWDDERKPEARYLEREPLTLEEVQHDIEWARTWSWDR
jgi:hypothetical protein